ncbi:MAG TPA: hypothetical protein VH438_10030 [Gemmatimonadales bacterium]|jgi:hypothetical protein
MRFAKAYLAATLAALVIFLTCMFVAGCCEDFPPNDLPEAFLFFGVYALGFTGALGLTGWLVLRLARLDRPWEYAVVGAVLGLIAAGIWDRELLSLNRLAIGFTLAGLGAAVVFRGVYGPSRTLPSSR